MSGTNDHNWKSYVGDNPDVSGFVNPPDPENYSDIMKFSACTNVHVQGDTIVAGQENNVDAVRGSNYTSTSCALLDGAGVSTFTIKGAIDGWTLDSCTIGRGKETDLEVGQFDKYWYVGRPATRNGKIVDCKSTDGAPISITCWNADYPTIINSNVKVTKIPALIWFPYFCFRWIWIRIFA